MPAKRRVMGKTPADMVEIVEASLPAEEAGSAPGDGQAGDLPEGEESEASVPVNPVFS